MALVDDGHPVADGLDHGHLMGDDDDCNAHGLVDLLQKLKDRFGGIGIQGAGGLVTEEYLWIGGNGPGNGYPLLLASGKLCRICVFPVLQSHQL